ncbi:MAG: aspartate aminotransferase [Lentisphaerae bacterium GWF2_52_8]|nr:MAG: aspartate aminotransferase [Lentisphaerae bacterium GWF2_52_8]
MANLTPSATLALTAKAKAMKAAGEDVCSMCAGETDFDTPDNIKQAAISALMRGETKYTPESGIIELRKAIVEKFRNENGISTSPEQVVVSAGAKFSIFCAVVSLCGPGDEVILPAPYWVSYPEIIKSAGAKPVFLPCDMAKNYVLDPAALEAVVTPRTKLLILNSPSNPIGIVYPRKTIEAVAALALKHKFMVLSDEIYEKLVYDPELPHVSIGGLSKEMNDLTVTVNGFSKSYSMTGWRLGFLTAPLWLAKRICAFQSHSTSNPTSFAQYGAIEALVGDQALVQERCRIFGQRRDLIYKLASEISGVKPVRPSGAFYLFCDISSFGMPSAAFCEKMLADERLAVIPGAPFGADNCIRLSYACSDGQIKESMKRLKNFCMRLKS